MAVRQVYRLRGMLMSVCSRSFHRLCSPSSGIAFDEVLRAIGCEAANHDQDAPAQNSVPKPPCQPGSVGEQEKVSRVWIGNNISQFSDRMAMLCEEISYRNSSAFSVSSLPFYRTAASQGEAAKRRRKQAQPAQRSSTSAGTGEPARLAALHWRKQAD